MRDASRPNARAWPRRWRDSDGVRRVWPSDANFLLVEFEDAARRLERAHAAGLLVRDCARRPGSAAGAAHQRRQPGTERSPAREPAHECHARYARSGAVRRSRRHADRGAARRAGRSPRQDAPAARRVRGAARTAGAPATGWSWSPIRTASAASAIRARASSRCSSSCCSCSAPRASSSTQVFICPHLAHEQCECRKPRTGLVPEYLRQHSRSIAQRSAMIGDRDTDLEFARNLGIRGLRVRRDGGRAASTAGRRSRARCWRAARSVAAQDARDRHRGRSSNSTATRRCRIDTGIGFFDHMLEQLAKHGGFRAAAELPRRSAHRRAPHGRGLRAGARRGAAPGARRQGRHRPLRLSAGRWTRARRRSRIDLSGRAVFRLRRPASAASRSARCRPSWCRISFARSRDSLGAALHLTVRGENTHHMIEACFKGVGRALRPALRREGHDLPSTKGAL